MGEAWDLSISESQIACVAEDINGRGYGVLAGALSETDLQLLRDIIFEIGDDPQGRYARLQDISTLAGTAVAELPQSPSFISLCQRLYALGTGSTTQETGFYQVFRCLKGDVGQKNSYFFHYDTYVLTVLVPIIIPEEGARGDLLIFPNMRPIRRTYWHNLFDKALVDNALSQKLLKLAAIRGKIGVIRIRMRPGSLYLFWGYRTIHANEPCDPDMVRATALIHFGDPYRGSKTRTLLRNARHIASA